MGHRVSGCSTSVEEDNFGIGARIQTPEDSLSQDPTPERGIPERIPRCSIPDFFGPTESGERGVTIANPRYSRKAKGKDMVGPDQTGLQRRPSFTGRPDSEGDMFGAVHWGGGEMFRWTGEGEEDTLAGLVGGRQTRQLFFKEERLTLQVEGRPTEDRRLPVEAKQVWGTTDVRYEERAANNRLGGDDVQADSGQDDLIQIRSSRAVPASGVQGRSGGMCVMWKDNIDIEVVFSNTYIIIILVTSEPADQPWMIYFFYGSPYQREKYESWRLVESTTQGYNDPWLLLGDLNTIFDSEDKLGEKPFRAASCAFAKEATQKAGLIDLGFSGQPFTWNNKRRGGDNIKERLDRCLANADWMFIFPTTKIFHLPALGSDHTLLCLDTLPQYATLARTSSCRFTSSEEGEALAVLGGVKWAREQGLARMKSVYYFITLCFSGGGQGLESLCGVRGRLHEYVIDIQKFLEEETKLKEDEQGQCQACHLYMMEIEKGKKSKKDDRITSCCKMTSYEESAKLLPSFSKVKRPYHISFEDCNTNNVKYLHDDPLVIILKVGQNYLHTLLVDTGSATDILFKRAINVIGLKSLTTTITSFNGLKEYALGEITLPV
ncbi:hypothetical protein GIB67_041924 [Kingdonia uniflora]|uniref:Endonuclease/exonuclease/phosphatase domain-containing protein n=1 Tax=Kingdonia uniflora TaxID=39325 RepID=A0A7J7N1G6_9MAGN|nr:hypothetical protein GIB67_041924 [Kingdonia uniflora]